MAEKKIFKKETEGTVTVEDLVQSGQDVTNSSNSGLFNTPTLGIAPTYNRSLNEKCTGQPDNGAEICFGQDRPTTGASGLGGQGSYSPRIDLVVGRGSSMNGGDGPAVGDVVENNFASDAARIYICSRTNVDKDFGLAGFFQEIGNGRFKPRSAVAIKADLVRIIGREGVKIVTGRAQNIKAGPSGELNSQGGKIGNAPPIILCAGNINGRKRVRGGWFKLGKKEYVPDIQGVVRGENLVDCLKELDTTINHLISFTQMLANICSVTFNAMGVNWAQPHYPGVASASAMATNNFAATPLGAARRNHNAWEKNFLSRLFGYKYIVSNNVYSN